MTTERAGWLSSAGRRAAVAVGALLLGACQGPTQRVPLYLEPSSLSLFIDGEEVAGMPSEVVLRSDRAHVLFFRSDGYQPQRLVLRTDERDGEPALSPAEVRIRLVPSVPSNRELIIEPAAP